MGDQHFCKCFDHSDSVRQTGRNLVVCIDPVYFELGQSLRARNIDQLHKKLVKDKTQLTYYNSGVGTFMPPSTLTLRYWRRRIDGTLNLQIAWDFDRIIKEAYRWLAENYQDGDVIYCFGYSRGALLVLTLAEMIAEVGLIHKGTEEQLAYSVYALYIDPNSHITPVNGSESMAQQFKQAHSRNVRVHFVGVWDALSQVGIIRRNWQETHNLLPGTYNPHVACYFRHALALDEHRVMFLPLYSRLGMRKRDANRPDSPPTSFRDLNVAVKSSEPENPETRLEGKDNLAAPRVKEVWFSGTHRDIGGRNGENEEFELHNPSFLWMLYEATSLRLKLNTSKMEYRWHELGNTEELLRGVWNLLEFLPIKRPTSDDALRFTHVPHWGKGRTIRPGQKIHASVAFCPKGYTPKARLPHEIKDNWHDLVGMDDRFDMDWTRKWNGLLELDIFDTESAVSLVNHFKDLSAHEEDIAMWVHRLNMMTHTHEGRRTLGGVPGAAKNLLLSIKNEWRPAMKVAVIDAVQSFAYYPIPCMKENPPDPGLSLVLVSLLEHGPTYYNSIAMFFAKFLTERWCAQIFQNDIVPSLCRLLLGSNEEKARCMDALSVFCAQFNDEAFDQLWKQVLSSTPGLRDVILTECMSESSKLAHIGLSLIKHLARHEQYHEIPDATLVITLLTHQRENVRMECLKTIAFLVRDEHARRKMAKEWVIGLGSVLQDGSWRVRVASLDVIRALVQSSSADEGVHNQIVDSTIWTSLPAILNHDHEDVREAGLRLIEGSLAYDIFHRAMVNEQTGDTPLRRLNLHELLNDDCVRVRWQCRRTLVELGEYDDIQHELQKWS